MKRIMISILVIGLISSGLIAQESGTTGIYNDGKIDYATSKVSFSLTGSDNLSDIKTVMYRIDAGEYVEYQNPISIAEEGLHTVYYYSIDNVGNKSPEFAYSVIIDNTAPEVNITPSVKLYEKDGKFYAPANVKYFLSAIDNAAGVKLIEYSVDGGDYTAYNEPITLDKGGDHTIKYRATDNVGNVSAEKTLAVFMDDTKPTVKIVPSGNFYVKGGKNYAPRSFTYTVEAIDSESGIEKILVSIDGGEFTLYQGPISIDKEGEHTITAKAVDNVGNISDEVKLTFIIDITPPQIELKPTTQK